MIAESKRDHIKAFILSALFSFTSLFLVSQLRFKLSYQESTQGKPIVVELVEIPPEVPQSTPKPQKKVETPAKKEPKPAKKVEVAKPKPKEATPPKIESPIYEEVKQEKHQKQEETSSPPKSMQEEYPKASGETPKEEAKSLGKGEAKAKEGAPSPPAPPPAPKAQEQPKAGENLLSQYLSRVRSIVERRKYYPPEAKRYGVEGKVSLRISVDASGRITQVELTNSSGSRILDRAAQDLIRSIGSLPPPPEGKPLTFVLSIDYRLED